MLSMLHKTDGLHNQPLVFVLKSNKRLDKPLFKKIYSTDKTATYTAKHTISSYEKHPLIKGLKYWKR